MNHPTAHELLDRFNEIERKNMIQCKNCRSFALNDAPETGLCDKCVLKKRISELEAQVSILQLENCKGLSLLEDYKKYCEELKEEINCMT